VPTLEKERVVEVLRAQVRTKLESVVLSQRATQSGATHEETRQEHPKDTRAIEAGYLARGLAERVETLENDAALLQSLQLHPFRPDDEVGLTALVGLLSRDRNAQVVFLVPCAGGEVVRVDDTSIQCLTPGSPLGRALLGREVGDEVVVRLPGGDQALTLTWIL
jgi:transcription elongation GreA/GreB family factor